MKTMLFFPEQIESERFFSDVNFWSKSDFSIKIELKNWLSGKYFFSKIWLFEKFFIIKSAATKNSQFKTWPFGNFLFKFSLCMKTFASESDSFFSKNSFQTLIFNEKVCYKIMPFKMSTKSEQFVVLRGANRVKTLFPRCDVFIKVWFLNYNWIQNLNFRKKFSLHKTIIGKVFFEIRNDEKLSIQKLINF